MASPTIMQHLLTTTFTQLRDFLSSKRQAKFRAKQINAWLFKQYVTEPSKMSNLPKELQAVIAEEFCWQSSTIVEKVEADDGTTKLLLELQDKEVIEMVIIPSPKRVTFCLSTQVGCPVQCYFCASGANGLKRNLTDFEILEQLYHGIAVLGRLPDNIVFMGIGEGLLNFDNLANALAIMTEHDKIGMSARRITVSTSGFIPGIKQLAALRKPFTLAISLHAPNDEIRAKLIPDKLRYSVADILAACDEYHAASGRMVTFEYTLLAGFNDSVEAAIALAKLARQHHAKINLIPYNQTDSTFKRPAAKVIQAFANTLEEHGANVTLRREKGSNSAAACGQLRIQHTKKQ